MRRRSFIPPLALMGVLALPCSPVSAQPYSQQHRGAQVDVGIFYDGLAPYGDWVEMPDYGWSWAPRVERGWRPYTRGQWVMTDDGWYWDSDEQFGWAAYHYGRWVNDPYYGWVWVPGTEWAPAWVSWRHGNGYTGWAPLPPRATWRTHVGLSFGGLEIDAFIGARDYAFVRDQAFVDRGVYQRVLPPTQNVTIINVTNNVTNYTVVNERDRQRRHRRRERRAGRGPSRAARAHGRRGPGRRFEARDGGRSRRVPSRGEGRAREEAGPGHERGQGEQPPPLLVERRKERQQERQQKGSEPDSHREGRSSSGDQAGTTAGQEEQTPRASRRRRAPMQRPSNRAQRQRDQASTGRRQATREGPGSAEARRAGAGGQACEGGSAGARSDAGRPEAGQPAATVGSAAREPGE